MCRARAAGTPPPGRRRSTPRRRDPSGRGRRGRGHPPRAGEHAHQRGRQRDVAQVAREPALGHRGHGDHQERGGRAEREGDAALAGRQRTTSATTAPASAGTASTAAERTNTSTNGIAAKAAESGLGSRARRRRAAGCPSRSTRGRTTGRRSPEAADHQHATARVAPRQPQAVEPEEGPHLGAQQARPRSRAGTRRAGARRGGARRPTGTAPRAAPRSCRAGSCG